MHISSNTMPSPLENNQHIKAWFFNKINFHEMTTTAMSICRASFLCVCMHWSLLIFDDCKILIFPHNHLPFKKIKTSQTTEIDFFHLPLLLMIKIYNFYNFSNKRRRWEMRATLLCIFFIIFSHSHRPQCASNNKRKAHRMVVATLDDLVFLFSEQMMSLTCTQVLNISFL